MSKGKQLTDAINRIRYVECENNGGCGECACPCHTDVADPGQHIPTCKFADIDYTPPDFIERVQARLHRAGNPGDGSNAP